MANRILIPLDGSITAERIFPYVRGMLRGCSSEATFFRSFTCPSPGWAHYASAAGEVKREADQYVEGQARLWGAEGYKVRGVVAEGPAAEMILKAANDEKADLIAMTTHGHSGVERLSMGSITESVLRMADIPMLIARSVSGRKGMETLPREAPPFRRVLIPLVEGDLSQQILDPALALCSAFDASAVLLTITEPGISAPSEVRWLRDLSQGCAAAGVPAEVIVRCGNPEDEILEAARQVSADLIAMTSHGRSGVFRWVLGSVTESVLRETSFPMLVTRAGKKAGKVASWEGREA